MRNDNSNPGRKLTEAADELGFDGFYEDFLRLAESVEFDISFGLEVCPEQVKMAELFRSLERQAES